MYDFDSMLLGTLEPLVGGKLASASLVATSTMFVELLAGRHQRWSLANT